MANRPFRDAQSSQASDEGQSNCARGQDNGRIHCGRRIEKVQGIGHGLPGDFKGTV